MIIQSNTLLVQSTIEKTCHFLSLPANIEVLLPKDRVSEFTADDLGCQFKVQGGIIISLVFAGMHDKSILYKSGTSAPFPFSLQIVLRSMSSGIEGYLLFNGDAPAMVAMLAKNPLTALFNEMGQNLKIQMESQG